MCALRYLPREARTQKKTIQTEFNKYCASGSCVMKMMMAYCIAKKLFRVSLSTHRLAGFDSASRAPLFAAVFTFLSFSLLAPGTQSRRGECSRGSPIPSASVFTRLVSHTLASREDSLRLRSTEHEPRLLCMQAEESRLEARNGSEWHGKAMEGAPRRRKRSGASCDATSPYARRLMQKNDRIFFRLTGLTKLG